MILQSTRTAQEQLTMHEMGSLSSWDGGGRGGRAGRGGGGEAVSKENGAYSHYPRSNHGLRGSHARSAVADLLG